MRVFNRLIVVLLLAGLVALGVFAALYGFGLFGYRVASLSRAWESFKSALRGIVGGVENDAPATIAVLVVVAIVGLVFLVLELKPRRPRRVRLGKGTYLRRAVVEGEVTKAATRTPGVLSSSVKVKARRRPGAKVKLAAKVDRGEEMGSVKSNLRENVRGHLAQSGMPPGGLKVKVNEADPRESKARVR
jgi:hypothetical protein